MTPDNNRLQKWIDSGTKIPAGPYHVDAMTGLRARSGSDIDLTGVILHTIPNGWNKYYALLRIDGVSGVTISGGVIHGDRQTHIGIPGESGMGIAIRRTTGARLIGVECRDCCGDGVYISNESSDITLTRVRCLDNRRNGLTITSARGVIVQGGEYSGTNGTLPKLGIDVEVNLGETVDGVTVDGAVFVGNRGGGFRCSVPIQHFDHAWTRNITVTGCTFLKNGEVYQSLSALRAQQVRGVTFIGNTLVENIGMGIDVRHTPDVTIRNNNVAKTYRSQHPTLTQFDAGLVIDTCTGVVLADNLVSDNRGRGISLSKAYGTAARNVSLRNKLGNNGQMQPTPAGGV